MVQEGREAVRGNELSDNYEAKVLHDLASNDAIYCNRPLSRKTNDKCFIAAKLSKTVRLGRVENSLSINNLISKRSKRFTALLLMELCPSPRM